LAHSFAFSKATHHNLTSFETVVSNVGVFVLVTLREERILSVFLAKAAKRGTDREKQAFAVAVKEADSTKKHVSETTHTNLRSDNLWEETSWGK
jgi:hypothetical protein